MTAAFPSISGVLSELDQWASYERTASPRDISRMEGIRTLLGRLGNPEQGLRVIHIAGTNGKGLTAKMLCTLLRLHGFSTGSYSSPHLRDIRERITFNGEWISRESFIGYAQRVLKEAKSLPVTPRVTYFDLLTAIALHAFHESKIDWTVLETGLGGRADSTNVTPKELCILTRIGLDHQDVLGDSLEQIAQEKMGISRKGIPLVLARQLPEMRSRIPERLQEIDVPVIDADSRFTLETVGTVPGMSDQHRFLRIHLPGGESLRFQREHWHTGPWREALQTSLAAAELLVTGGEPDWEKWIDALRGVRMEGRLDLRRGLRWKGAIISALVLDGGHNADALQALVRQLNEWELRDYNLVLALSRDKMRAEIMGPLRQLCKGARLVVPTSFSSPRSATPEQLYQFLDRGDCLTDAHESHLSPVSQDAFSLAAELSERPIVVAGSFYLVGEVLWLLENQ